MFDDHYVWWLTAVELPVLSGLFWMIWRGRREAEGAVRQLRDVVEARNSQMREALAAFKLECAVKEITSRQAKDVRILDALDAVLAARALHVHEGVYATPFIREMQEWAPGRKGGRDDGLDAVAGALAMAPVRIKAESFGGRQGWQGGGGVHKARSDFDV